MRPVLVGLVALAVVFPPTLHPQTPLVRSPNLGGTWVPDRGVVQFNFLHRFYVTPPPARAVINLPTFTFALGLPSRLALGTRYSTHSNVPGPFNEFELFARWRLEVGSRDTGSTALSVAITPAYNFAAKSVDGELGIDWTRGRFTLSGAARAMSNAYGADRARAALAGGAVVRLNSYVALAGDVASLLDTDPGETVAWSAGLLFIIPGSPHLFSLHASNVDVNTIQGSSKRGVLPTAVDKLLYGFEFTIPLHLKRFSPWFRSGGRSEGGGAATTGIAAEVRISEFRFRADTVVIAAGQTVRWTNADPVDHSVTFESGVTSSELIPVNGTFWVRFDRPGTYSYHCTPHPFMKGVVVVR